MGKSAPSAPDPYQTAQAQAQANAEAVRESAKVNAVDQITPYGTVTYTRDAQGVPTQQVTSLTPVQQQVLDQQNQLALALSGAAQQQAQYLPSTRFSVADQFGSSPAATDYGAQAEQVQQSVYDRGYGLLRPQFERSNVRMEQDINNRGLDIRGEAAKDLRDQQYQREQEALGQLAYQAVQAGGAEQNRLFNLQNQARQQGIYEYQLDRQQPFNELSAFLQGTPIFQQSAPAMTQYQIAPSDVAGNIYANYNAQNQAYQNNLGGLYGLGGTLAGAAVGGPFGAAIGRTIFG